MPSARFRRAVAALLLSAAALGHAPALLARESAAKPESSEGEDASGLVARGIALRRSGEDARALELFQQAEQLEPESTRIQVHLAATHQALGHWEAADRYLTRALQNPEDPYIERHQATLAAARRVIDGHIGSLQLSGGPRGAEVRLNGRLVGTLPMQQTVRVEAGIYTLEARLPGHYPVTRSVALASGALVRESVDLVPLSSAPAHSSGATDEAPARSSGSSWLTWTFAGVAAGAGIATVVAWVVREQHADAWNDDSQCLRVTQTREQACHGERVIGERAERWMYVGAALTGAAAVGAVVSAVLNQSSSSGARDSAARGARPADTAPRAGLVCGVGLAQLSCSGRF